jgi:hypothetical protein
MEFLYCFANASLTRRVLNYLLRQMRAQIDCITVIFLNDRWVIRLKLAVGLDAERGKDCCAFLSEHGIPYRPPLNVRLACRDLDVGCALIQVMNRHHVAIVSHGLPQPEKVGCFREQVVAGLGYYPQSLI